MGPTWVLSAPDGPHIGPMNLAIRVVSLSTGSTGEPQMNCGNAEVPTTDGLDGLQRLL